MFALSLPAGVLADTTDRRRMMLASLGVHRRHGQHPGEGDRRRSGRGADFFGVVGKAGLSDKPASLRLPKGEIGDVRFTASISIR